MHSKRMRVSSGDCDLPSAKGNSSRSRRTPGRPAQSSLSCATSELETFLLLSAASRTHSVCVLGSSSATSASVRRTVVTRSPLTLMTSAGATANCRRTTSQLSGAARRVAVGRAFELRCLNEVPGGTATTIVEVAAGRPARWWTSAAVVLTRHDWSPTRAGRLAAKQFGEALQSQQHRCDTCRPGDAATRRDEREPARRQR